MSAEFSSLSAVLTRLPSIRCCSSASQRPVAAGRIAYQVEVGHIPGRIPEVVVVHSCLEGGIRRRHSCIEVSICFERMNSNASLHQNHSILPRQMQDL